MKQPLGVSILTSVWSLKRPISVWTFPTWQSHLVYARFSQHCWMHACFKDEIWENEHNKWVFKLYNGILNDQYQVLAFLFSFVFSKYRIAGYFRGCKISRFSFNKVYEIFWRLLFWRIQNFYQYLYMCRFKLKESISAILRYPRIRENLHPRK